MAKCNQLALLPFEGLMDLCILLWKYMVQITFRLAENKKNCACHTGYFLSVISSAL